MQRIRLSYDGAQKGGEEVPTVATGGSSSTVFSRSGSATRRERKNSVSSPGVTCSFRACTTAAPRSEPAALSALFKLTKPLPLPPRANTHRLPDPQKRVDQSQILFYSSAIRSAHLQCGERNCRTQYCKRQEPAVRAFARHAGLQELQWLSVVQARVYQADLELCSDKSTAAV